MVRILRTFSLLLEVRMSAADAACTRARIRRVNRDIEERTAASGSGPAASVTDSSQDLPVEKGQFSFSALEGLGERLAASLARIHL